MVGEVSLCLQFTDEERGLGLIRTIERLQRDLAGGSDVVILFRDREKPIEADTAPETRKAFADFSEAGGYLLEIETEWLADFRAVILLRRAVEKGYLSYTTENGEEVKVTMNHFRDFLENDFKSGLLERLASILEEAGSKVEA